MTLLRQIWLNQGAYVSHAVRWHREASIVRRRSRRWLNRPDADFYADAQQIKETFRESAESRRDILDVFALVMHACRRAYGFEVFPHQIVAGLAMLEGFIIEMQTGEGKTLTSVLPAAVWGMRGRGSHVVTTNDYLAGRDAHFAGRLLHPLGLSVGSILHAQPRVQRLLNYRCDVVYATEKEIGFDWLREVLAHERDQFSEFNGSLHRRPSSGHLFEQRGFESLIIDEADSILVDRAYTPLLLAEERSCSELDLDLYTVCRKHLGELRVKEDYRITSHKKRVELTPSGRRKLTLLSNGYRFRGKLDRDDLYRAMEDTLTSEHCYHVNKDYAFREGHLEIVEPETGRILPGRRWNKHLQLAVEIKEGNSEPKQTSSTAQMTIQQMTSLYRNVAGMTGTAWSCRRELHAAYKLSVVCIPTRKRTQRVRYAPRVFPDLSRRNDAILLEADRLAREGRAVLSGTTSIVESYELAKVMESRGIPFELLNALQDENEARTIALAGRSGQITIATNMAGRGTDIKLEEAVSHLGGLHVILAGMHDSRRVDRQLIGRCARQGEPGSYRAFVSLEDELFDHASLSQRKKRERLKAQYQQSPECPAGLIAFFRQTQRSLESTSGQRFVNAHRMARQLSSQIERLKIPSELIIS